MERNNAELTQLVECIVRAAHPLRILLFGSAARGEMTGESDLDVLVVMPEGSARRQTEQLLHTQLMGFPLPVDLMVATPGLLERHKDNIGLIYRVILEEGKEIYAA